MASLSEKIKNLLRWCKVTRDGGSDSDQFPVQQVGYLEKVGDALMWFPFGYHANIPAETLALMLSMQGNSEARVALPGSPVGRPAVAAGEVVVYHPATLSRIHFKANGDIEVTTKTKIKVTAPLAELIGDMTVSGDVTVAGDVNVTTDLNVTGDADVTGSTTLGATVTSNGKDISDTHIHIGSPSAPTGAVSNTGIPV